MALQSGTQLGPYEITEIIGTGGMGEVYRARDTRLGRTVAVKVLPSLLSDKPELRDRFEREAHAISNLNHPHICTLHDVGRQDGIDFLVMEYLEGESLAARLERGPLPLADALKVAIEIGDALDKAHRQGIVHRDLKPGNVMLTKNGAKLLDFGLAKLRGSEGRPVAATVTAMPTDAANLTAAGAILGTLQYMSPEQLEGREADARADIFAFGTTLYEMLTGRKAFIGKSQVSLMAAILEHEPPRMATLQPILPQSLDDIVSDCLIKDPDDRSQSIRDVVRQLKRIAAGKSSGVPVAAESVPQRSRILPVLTGGLLVVVIVLLIILLKPASVAPRQMVRFEVLPPPGLVFPGANNIPRFAVSPDGRYLVYSANSSSAGFGQLWLRKLDSTEANPIPGTDSAQQPFWSPDSRTIGFFADNKMKKVDINGGAVQSLCNIAGSNFGGTWNSEGVILFGSSETKGLQRVASAGGVPVQVTSLQDQEVAHLWPRFLPDGEHFIYQSLFPEVSDNSLQIGALKTGERKFLTKSPYGGDFALPDRLLFIREGALLSQRLDLATFTLQGEPQAVAESVGSANNGRAGFSVSRTGVLVYRRSEETSGEPLQPEWVDRKGQVVSKVGQPAVYRGIDLSPDGASMATHIEEAGEKGDISILDVQVPGASIRRFTFDPSRHFTSAIWSPDGRYIYYSSVASSTSSIFRRETSGQGSEEKLVDKIDGVAGPLSVSPDGQWLLIQSGGAPSSGGLWILQLTGTAQLVRYSDEKQREASGQISPDGHWVAYQRLENGFPQIKVLSFPTPGTIFHVSDIGSRPRWSHDGSELFFERLNSLWSVTVERRGSTLAFGNPVKLFQLRTDPLPHTGPLHDYAVSPDGQRFLIAQPASLDTPKPSAVPLTVVLNWETTLSPQN
jgi:eukaryotic-like serine/threonine-protein kinase